MTIKTYNTKGFIAAFILSFVLILIVSAFSLGYGRRVTRTLENGEKHYKLNVRAATRISSFAKRAEGHLMLYLAFHQPLDKKKITVRIESLKEEIAVIDRLVKDDRARELTEQIKEQTQNIPSVIAPLLLSHDREFKAEGRFTIIAHRTDVLAAHDIFSNIRKLGVDLAELELELENEVKKKVVRAADKLRILLYIVTIAILIFIVFLGIILMQANLDLNREIIQRKQAELKRKHGYETQSAVNELLSDSLGDANIMELLDECLNIVLSLPWLAFEAKGCIFLIEEEPDVLVMKAHHGFSDELIKICSRIPFGQCLCGKAALNKTTVFSNHIDADHVHQTEGMTEHGHYCVPILVKNEVLGVINIHVKKGHVWEEFEETFLTAIANTMAGILIQRYGEEEKKTIEDQLSRAQKLESIGQLAAGIAHEINTPVQYIGDNTDFLKNSFDDLNSVISAYDKFFQAAKKGRVDKALIRETESLVEEAELEFLKQEIPNAIEQSIDGLNQVGKIVKSMKEFSHPGEKEKILTDLNKALENTILVAKNEWKYVAELKTDFDASLPLVICNPGELNQVFLNMIINAAHSIEDALRDKQVEKSKGIIQIRTKNKGEWVEIRISDTGRGIPQNIQNKIFDPFFTTKEVGKGTGQGLAISHSFIVDEHNGRISFKTRKNRGTTFIIELPVQK